MNGSLSSDMQKEARLSLSWEPAETATEPLHTRLKSRYRAAKGYFLWQRLQRKDIGESTTACE